MREKEKIPAKEKMFCHYYTQLGNGKEAAIRAGYPARVAEKQAAKLLLKPSIRDWIAHLDESGVRRQATKLAVQGLERLAFGAINDAVGLLVREEPVEEEQLAEWDLFGVSEIKQSKGGGVEIKFFDRLKALELLLRCGQENGTKQAASLYEALEKGAAAVSESAGEECAL